jgi:hypothetical protein
MLSEPYTRHWTNTAYKTVSTWHEQPLAKELLARVDELERWADQLAGYGDCGGLSDAVGDKILELWNELEELRNDAVNEALLEYPQESDGYVEDELRDAAPRVDDALKIARRAEREPWAMPVRSLGGGKYETAA